MAVKKLNKVEEAKEEKVETPQEDNKEVENVEVSETGLEVETQTTPIEEPQVEVEENQNIQVDTTEVEQSKKKSGTAKIKMRTDHKCCIAMERYDLKAGKTYVVPENVKNILNKAGLLLPL